MILYFYVGPRPIINFELASIAGHPSTCDATPGNSVTCDGWCRA